MQKMPPLTGPKKAIDSSQLPPFRIRDGSLQGLPEDSFPVMEADRLPEHQLVHPFCSQIVEMNSASLAQVLLGHAAGGLDCLCPRAPSPSGVVFVVKRVPLSACSQGKPKGKTTILECPPIFDTHTHTL